MTSQVTQALSALYESVDYGLELITPEQAQFYLEKNFDNNRKISRNNLEELKKEMRNNRFILSDSAICFDTDGLLVNGQHRLLAVVQTGLTQPFLVVKNMPSKSKQIMDVGKSRNMSDRITVSGTRISRKDCATIRHAMATLGSTTGTEQYARPCHDAIVAETYLKHNQFLYLMNKVCPANTTRVRSFFLAASLKIYAEMMYNNKISRGKKYNHDMSPKERALHWLNIVTTGMASAIDGIDRDIKPCDRAAQIIFNKSCDSGLKRAYWSSADAFALTVRAAHHFMLGMDTQYIRVPKEDPFREFIELPSTNQILTMTPAMASK